MHATASTDYSIVIPAHDEEACLRELASRIASFLDELNGSSEVILVDDGSGDRSFEIMREIAHSDRRFKVLRLSRNFGHQIAITAGIDFAVGDAVIIMDADLQHPVETIHGLIAKRDEGYDVVYGIRSDRASEPFAKRVTARCFYRGINRLTDLNMPPDAGDFRLVTRNAIDAFKSLRESNRYVRGMFAWIGFEQTGVDYPYRERFAGESKYHFRRMLQLAAAALTSFSTAPLRAALHLGFAVSLLSFTGAIVAIVTKLAGAAVPGWTSVIVYVSFIGGVQLFVLGVMGTYIGRLYDEAKGRPLYIVRDLEGFDNVRSRPPRAVVATSFHESA